jgi:hypothetical protein
MIHGYIHTYTHAHTEKPMSKGIIIHDSTDNFFKFQTQLNIPFNSKCNG